MLKIPIEQIVERIVASTGKSTSEVEGLISSKMAELSGLISRQGAAHIIANEFGINLFDSTTGKLKISKILAGMRNVETVGKVQRIFEAREFKTASREGKVGSIIVGDDTGVIRFVFWGDKTDQISLLKEGDIVKVEGGYVRENQGRKEIHLNDRSNVILNPAGENIEVVKQYVSVRKLIGDLREGDENVELLGTIVQIYEPRFFEVCPQCGRRVKLHQDSYFCEDHKTVTPSYSYVVNFTLDDGSLPEGNIRVVSFRNQANKLFGKEDADVLKLKSEMGLFEDFKADVLGRIVKVIGRAVKNTMFERLEFMSQMVFRDPNPEDELRRLEKQSL